MWRNKSIFKEDFQHPVDPTYVILKMAKDIDMCDHTHSTGWPQHMDTIYIGWKRPLKGWIKLNCDGAYKKSVHLSGCGGPFLDFGGRWLKGYILKIGTCNALHSKMWGMFKRMKMA
ncbi:ribonuclease H protein [Trifolium medium]|uniref:Ribonuclease H protein n=1 Tax=Trifolium medium TaxID=97028 RepID=A0A392M0N5_9FABA|nr:ribonuclease H protein [Trifolium medium]